MIVWLEQLRSNVLDFVVGSPTLAVVLFLLIVGFSLMRLIDNTLTARRRRAANQARNKTLSKLLGKISLQSSRGDAAGVASTLQKASDRALVELLGTILADKGYAESGSTLMHMRGQAAKLIRGPKGVRVAVTIAPRADELDILAVKEFRDVLTEQKCPRGYLLHLGELGSELEGRLAKISELFSIKVVTRRSLVSMIMARTTARQTAPRQKLQQAPKAVAG